MLSVSDLNGRRDISPFENGPGLARVAASVTLLENCADIMGSVHFEEASVLLLRQVTDGMYIPSSW